MNNKHPEIFHRHKLNPIQPLQKLNADEILNQPSSQKTD